ncbi:MAG TPA: hypothetical protein PK054_00495 [Anaerohalosphaeraceae bacterium]|nr:hypothetical protein [Anaerohalosphaeraceae bacterium]HPP55041.1 hypothetical protein [Anaerohalosphaeraceae bacterium]
MKKKRPAAGFQPPVSGREGGAQNLLCRYAEKFSEKNSPGR